jgi:Na+-translocating ferredoxin:NAD+ oxidoreductase subunit G
MSNVTQMPAVRNSTPSAKLLMTLSGAGMIAGLLIVSAFNLTLPAIEGNRAARLEAAILEVIPRATTSKPLYLVGGNLLTEPPPGADAKKLDRMFAGYDASGKLIGYAIPSSAVGFADNIVLIFGYDTAAGEVLGMKVLESKETPGLGDKVEKNLSFVSRFKSALVPLKGVTAGRAKSKNDIDVITGATISSRTVIRAINNGVEKWREPITTFEKKGRS